MIPRFGNAYHQLPAHCLVPAPVRAPERFERFWSTQYEGLLSDLLGMGVPVPGFPGACAGPECSHGLLYHRQRTRTSPCLVQGCECLQYQRRVI